MSRPSFRWLTLANHAHGHRVKPANYPAVQVSAALNAATAHQIPLQSRSYYRKVQEPKVAVVTGTTRGIGFAIARQLCQKLAQGDLYLTTRGDTESLNTMLRNDIGFENPVRTNFRNVEVTDVDSIVKFRNEIHQRHGKIDILINNAGQYFYPSKDPIEHFRQAEKTMLTNYWGLKNMCKAFIPMLDPQARIVNISSHLGHSSLIPSETLRDRFADNDLTEAGLDQLVMEYQEHCTTYKDDFAAFGWPSCAYTVSKVAVNAYTRILQRYFDEHGKEDVIVNSIHPGSFHSKITQESPLTAEDSAEAVVCCALLSHPCDQPRGRFIWHDLQIVDWSQGNLDGMWA